MVDATVKSVCIARNPTRAGIYSIVNQNTGKTYVGSSQNIDARWHGHRSNLRKGKHHSRRLQNSWNKHGEAAFSLQVLELVANPSMLFAREQVWLDALRSAKNGYNIYPQAGGPRGHKHSHETRLQMSLRRKGKPLGPKSPEHKAKLSAIAKSRIYSLETRAKMSASRTGRKHPPRTKEQRERVRAAALTRKYTPEMLARMSEQAITRFTGRKHKPETIAKMVRSRLKREVKKNADIRQMNLPV